MKEADTVYDPVDTPLIEYEPDASAAAPKFVPSTVTFAPARPLPFSSVTVPEIDCPMAKERLRIRKIQKDLFLVYSFGFVFVECINNC
jgi:hypothetical protein